MVKRSTTLIISIYLMGEKLAALALFLLPPSPPNNKGLQEIRKQISEGKPVRCGYI